MTSLLGWNITENEVFFHQDFPKISLIAILVPGNNSLSSTARMAGIKDDVDRLSNAIRDFEVSYDTRPLLGVQANWSTASFFKINVCVSNFFCGFLVSTEKISF